MFDLHPLNSIALMAAFADLLHSGQPEEQLQALLATPLNDEVAQAIVDRTQAIVALKYLVYAVSRLPIQEPPAFDLYSGACHQIFAIGWQAAMDHISKEGLPPDFCFTDDLFSQALEEE